MAINRLAALNILPCESLEVDFKPDESATQEWAGEVLRRSGVPEQALDQPLGSRGDFCQRIWLIVQRGGWSAFEFSRQSPDDADIDGIPDTEDALLFTPNEPIQFQIQREPLTPDRDGIAGPTTTAGSRAFDFCGPEVKPSPGFVADHGLRFDARRGFGWTRDLSRNYRQRRRLDGPRDSFIFTRQTDRWQCVVANGAYRVTVCVGDSGHQQLQQSVTVEGRRALDRANTAEGEFAEVTIDVQVVDDRLTIDIGSGEPNSNTCLNWVQIEPHDSNPPHR